MNQQPTDRDRAVQWARDLLQRDDWIILDTETTGLGPSAEIIQIAIVNSSGETLLNTLIKPCDPIPPEATAVHGITNEMIKTAPTFIEILPQIKNATHARTIIIYNSEFDTRILTQCCRRAGVSPVTDNWNRVDCAMRQSAPWFGEWHTRYGSYKWQPLRGGDHSAHGDCLATLTLIKRMAELDIVSMTKDTSS